MATGGGDGRGDDPALIDNSSFVSNVTCAICLETYRRPKVLPCFHTFCQSCLHNVAGTAPSFPCPACRAIVLLPDGGVAALQNNFYVEQELGTNLTAAAARLCDACDDDREASYSCFQCRQRFCSTCRRCHDSISSCRSHTVVPLQPVSGGNLKGNDGGAGNNNEEKCPKHKNQSVILHCVACKVSICIQCKLTSHEGHPTEDLTDTGNKAKASLQDTLKTLKEQVRKLEGVMETVKQKGLELQVLQENSERDIRQRTDTLCQRANECRDKTLQTLQSLNGEAISTLAETRTHVLHKKAALAARSEYVIRVLHEEKDTDIVTLNDQLKDAALDVDDVKQLLDNVASISKLYQLDHNATAVKLAQLEEYIGVLNTTGPGRIAVQSLSSSRSNTDNLIPCTPSKNLKDFATVHEMFFSKNRKSVVESICVTTEKRVWIRYKPSGEGTEMGLFNQNGLLQKVDNVHEYENQMLTCFADHTLCFTYCNEGSLYVAAECKQTPFRGSFWKINTSLRGVSKWAYENMFYALFESDLVYTKVMSVKPVQIQNVDVASKIDACKLFDVSQKQEYIAASGNNGVHIFCMPKGKNAVALRFLSSYNITEKRPVLDACFFTLNGKEWLLIIFAHDNNVHVVDHSDVCRFVRYLDTNPCIVNNPSRLATDQTSVLWIACKGGTVVMLNVN